MTYTLKEVAIAAGSARLDGALTLPEDAVGVVVFAHGSGSSRFSPRNTYVAKVLNESRIATVLFDLLTQSEDRDYERRFDIGLLTERLLAATRWLATEGDVARLPLGYFGASTGAAAALQAAATLGGDIQAVVSRGGRPDLAGAEALRNVAAPTLLIVGGGDDGVIDLNEQAAMRMSCEKEVLIVPRATHLFEEPGALEQVAKHASAWFLRHFGRSVQAPE